MDPSALTDTQMVIGVSLIVAVAAACQVVAPRLRVPALLLLLPAGFVLGIVVPGADPRAILGGAFDTVVDLTVALVLFQGAMDLGHRLIDRRDWHTVMRLVVIGGPITWGAAAVMGALLVGFPVGLAVLFGALVSVSGPTVVGPLLDVVRPESRVRNVLTWESVWLDPLGALAAVMVFQVIKAGQAGSVVHGVLGFLGGLGVAVAAALLGALAVSIGMRIGGTGRLPGTQVLLGSVILVAGAANAITDNAGLLAALLMGVFVVLLAHRAGQDAQLAEITPFFDTVATIAVGVLFVGLSAMVTPESLTPLLWPALLTAAVLIVVVRPAMVFLVTMGSGFTSRERLLIGWCDPRGIVAAATAASVSSTLVALGVPGATELLPVTFVIITATVFVYGLTMRPLANALGLTTGR